MASRNGRPRTPIALRTLHGNPNRTPIPAAPEGAGVLWKPPEWLDEEQRAHWHNVIERSPPRLLTETDTETLAVWCVAYVEYVRAVREVRRSGQVVETTNGNVIQSPYLSIMNRQALMMIKTGGELGFSPSARASLGSAMPRGANGSTAGSPQLANYLDGDKLDG